MAPTSIDTMQDTSVNLNWEWAKQLSSGKQITLVGGYWKMKIMTIKAEFSRNEISEQHNEENNERENQEHCFEWSCSHVFIFDGEENLDSIINKVFYKKRMKYPGVFKWNNEFKFSWEA